MDNNRRRYLNILRKMNLQDENSISTALRKKGFYSSSNTFPLSALHFELTSKCNAFCRHCYNNSFNGGIEDRMTPDKWKEFAEYLVKKGGVFECLISGGEPLLLGDDLLDIMDILHNDGSIFYLMTNGYLIDPFFARKLSAYKYHWLQISIDGCNPIYHDWFRRCPESWERAVNATKMLVNNGVPLKIAHCVTPYNLEQVSKMFELAVDLGASSIIAGELSLSGRTNSNQDLLLSSDQRKFLIDEINKACDLYGDKIEIKITNSVKSGLVQHAKHPRSNAVIRPNGDIRIDAMAPFVIGNVLDGDFEAIWEEKIDDCWNKELVQKFISSFVDDRNYDSINYVMDDIVV